MGGYALIVVPSSGFEVTFELFFSSSADGVGLLYFDATDHESLDLTRYSKAWLGAGTCTYARKPGGACHDLTSNAHAAWGLAAPRMSGLGAPNPIYNGCDQAMAYLATDGGDATKEQRIWDGTEEECTAAIQDTWVPVRVWVTPTSDGNSNMGIELDLNGVASTWSLQAIGLVPSEEWQLAIGSVSYNTQAESVQIRNVVLGTTQCDPSSPTYLSLPWFRSHCSNIFQNLVDEM